MALAHNLLETLRPGIIKAANGVRNIRLGIKSRLGLLGPLEILDYDGYGSSERIRIAGRVVEAKSIGTAQETDSVFGDMRNMYKRMTRMPIPGARVTAQFMDQLQEAETNANGFFEFIFRPGQTSGGHLWQDLPLKLLSPLPGGRPIETTGRALIPPNGARQGIISDIDDTVLPTEATNFLRMMRSLFLGNARTRLPFPGVAAFYRALYLGRDDTPINPIFYVSRGPWNLYDLLREFFQLHEIPIGPILNLREWGFSEEGLTPARPRGHKFRCISDILRTYPDLPFVLIGDSGQLDPEIYNEVVHSHPGRIKAVYIRKVDSTPAREASLDRLGRQLQRVGSPLIASDNTLEMARHAAHLGLIEERRLDDLYLEKAVGEQPPGLMEDPMAEGKKEG
jgi:phosphatidate phosphatase APP1